MEKKSNLSNIFNFIIFILLVAVFIRFNIRNPFRAFTGIPSPFEGIAESFESLLDLELSDAFRHYFIFWLIPLYLIFMLFENRLPEPVVKTVKFLVFVAIAVNYWLTILPHDFKTLTESYLASPLNSALTVIKTSFERIISML